jgi:3-hydroxybutyryl-CoA dehydratase
MTLLSIKKTNRFSINNLKKGMKIKMSKKMSSQYFARSIKLLNDTAPIHTNDKWAKRLGMKKKIFPGLAVVNVYSKMIGMYLPGKNAVMMSINFSFKKPVFENDKLVYICEITRVIKSIKVVLIKLSIFRNNYKIIDGDCKCKILNLND